MDSLISHAMIEFWPPAHRHRTYDSTIVTSSLAASKPPHCDAMSLCIEKVAAMECKYTNDVARCDLDMNGTCQLDAGVLCVVRITDIGVAPRTDQESPEC